MNVRIPDAAFAKLDRSEPADNSLEDWTPLARRTVTDSDVEQFIIDLAANNGYPDALGMYCQAGDLYSAVARQWVQNKEAVGTIIGPAFWQWAKSAANVAEFGKPIPMNLPAILVHQAGIK